MLRTYWPLFVLGITVALGAVLRIVPLNDRDYWYDEAFTGITIRLPWSEMMDIIVHDVHPPMYYFLLRGWATVFGSGPMDLRAFSVFFGLATIVLAYAVLRKWQPQSYVPALVGAFIIAINPFLVNYSQEARMYSLVTFAAILAAYFLTTQRRVAYSVTIAVLLLTHYLAALIVLTMFMWDAARNRWTFKWLVSGYLLPVIGFGFWVPSFLLQFLSTSGGLGWIPEFSLARIPTTIATFLFGAPVGVAGIPPMLGFQPDWLRNEYVVAVSFIVVVAILIGVTAKKRWDAHLALAAMLAFLPPLLTLGLQLLGQQLYVERYLIGASIFLILFMVMALYRLGTSWMLSGVLAYTILVALVQPWGHVADFQHLNTNDLPETVVFTTSFDFTVGRYYLGEDKNVLFYNVENVHANFDGWHLIGGYQITDLPTGDYVIITTTPEPFEHLYQQVDQSGNLVVLQSV